MPRPLTEKLELTAQACRAAHILSGEATCRKAVQTIETLQSALRSIASSLAGEPLPVDVGYARGTALRALEEQ